MSARKGKFKVLTAALLTFGLILTYTALDAFDRVPGFLTIEDTSIPLGAYHEPAIIKNNSLIASYQRNSELEVATAAGVEERINLIDPYLAKYDAKLAYSVIDINSNSVIAGRDQNLAITPASTMKILTAITAIESLGADTTLQTKVLLQGEALYLKGEGDMLLSAEKGEIKEGVKRASLADLADQCAAYLKQHQITVQKLYLDDSYFLNEPHNPAWEDDGDSSIYIAPIMPLAIDLGRADGYIYGAKLADPALAATLKFQELLAERGIEFSQPPVRASAAADALRIAQVSSAPIKDLVRQTMLYSDNTTAELLARLSARAQGLNAGIEGANQAVINTISEIATQSGLDFDLPSLKVLDNSGLSSENKLSPQLLTTTLLWLNQSENPQMKELFSAFPLAGYSGTLAKRFDLPEQAKTIGTLSGKTGALSQVSALSGYATLADGRQVAYAIFIYGYGSELGFGARELVDTTAALMVGADLPADPFFVPEQSEKEFIRPEEVHL